MKILWISVTDEDGILLDRYCTDGSREEVCAALGAYVNLTDTENELRDLLKEQSCDTSS